MAPGSRPSTRSAALLALPVAVLTAIGVFWLVAPLPGTDRSDRRSAGPHGTAPTGAVTPQPGTTPTGAVTPQPGTAPTGAVTPQPGTTPTGAVTLPAPSLDPAGAATCQALVDRLPQRLRDHDRRPVTAGAGQNAAWGDPPITLTCGPPGPSAPADAQVWLLNGVCWYTGDGTVWTTVDRVVPVTVTLTGVTGQGGQWVIDVSDPIAASVPRLATPPSGCR